MASAPKAITHPDGTTTYLGGYVPESDGYSIWQTAWETQMLAEHAPCGCLLDTPTCPECIGTI